MAAASAVLVGVQLPATAAGTAQSTIPSAVPGSTPNIVDGTDASGASYRVFDIAAVGNRIVVAGTFAQVQNPGSNGTVYNQANVFAFDPSTGLVDPAFDPVVNAPVTTVAPGPGGTVLIGGSFSTVNGANVKKLAELSLTDGSVASGFRAPAMNGTVNDVRLVGNRIFVAGAFTTVGGVAHGGLVSLTTAGGVDPYLSIDVAGHHNYPFNGKAQSPVQVENFDLTPDGSRMVVIGNFTSVEGQSRNQIAQLLLQSGAAVVDPNWATQAYVPACSASAFDYDVRDVQYSPDGSYFVVAATGGPHAGTLCDAAARFNTGDTGSSVQPYWVARTGGDSLWSVAVTGTAVYVGGHQRWMNNPLGSNSSSPGAVPRPGLAALDPLSGVPLSWNPARNPRGIGAEALLATGNAVYVGMDTDFIGNFKYRRQKLAAFTLAGGYTPPSQDTVSLPGTVYLGGRPSTVAGGVDALLDRSYDGGTNAGTATQGPSSDVLWSNARGAFMAGNTLFYGYQTSSGSYELASRTFDGSTFGPATFVESPYLDPAWAGVPTGSGTSTYDGKLPNFYGTGTSSLANVGGMFYANGRVYYVLKNQAALLYRNFSVDSGIVSGDSFTAIASGFGSAGGMFVSGGFLYVADRNSGNLSRMTFSGTAVGPATVVSGPTVDGQDWRTNALFLGPTPVITVNHPPTASFTYSCSGLNCSFTGSGSDPDGDPLTWAWDFGDGGSAAVQSPSHTYGAAGTFPVTLTVSDNRGGSTPSTQQVAVGQSTSSVGVRGAAGVSASTLKNSLALTVPAGVQAGDGLVLIVSTYSAATGSAPGFTQAFAQVTPGSTAGSTAMTTQVLQKVAGASDAGSTLTVTLSASAKATAQLVAYSGTAPAGPVRTAAGRPETAAGTSHTTPTATATAGDWVLSVWSDRSSNARTWTAPGNVVVRNELDGGASGGEISTLVADSGGPVSGTYGGLVATTSATSSKAADLTVVIAGS